MTTPIVPAVDLSQMFGPIRDQGVRPTCLAFAASDTHASLRTHWTPLSCEYAFYKAQGRANRSHNTGALLSSMLEVLKEDGQPPESAWQYLSPPIDDASWKPPAGVTPLFKRNSASKTTTMKDIVAELDQKCPVVVLMTLSPTFFSGGAGPGLIDADEPTDDSMRHAVVAVGHGTAQNQLAIKIRNSWGATWGDGGYAWVTEKYLGPRAFRLAILKEDLSVPSNSAAA